MDMMEIRRRVMEVMASGGNVQMKTGTFTGAGSATVEIPCPFEPDVMLIDSDLDSVTAWGSGIAKELFMSRKLNIVWQHNSATVTGFSMATMINDTLNTPFGWDGTTSGAPKAKYENGTVTLSNNNTSTAWAYFINGQEYTYMFYKVDQY